MSEGSDEEVGFLPVIMGHLDEHGDEEGEAEVRPIDPDVASIERSVILRQVPPDVSSRFAGVANTAKMILQGEYLQLLYSHAPTPMRVAELIPLCQADDVIDRITQRVWGYVQQGEEGVEERVLECMFLGFAYLELFCQLNYTGPELSDAVLAPLIGDAVSAPLIFEKSLAALECDGNYCFRICSIPQSLLVARVILSSLALPEEASWKQGVYLSLEGDILRPKSRFRVHRQTLAVLKYIRCPTWLNARAAVMHVRYVERVQLCNSYVTVA